ncbi:MAG: hypothetical protein WBL67_05145 [Nitrososphaeraceae archaeon]
MVCFSRLYSNSQKQRENNTPLSIYYQSFGRYYRSLAQYVIHGNLFSQGGYSILIEFQTGNAVAAITN